MQLYQACHNNNDRQLLEEQQRTLQKDRGPVTLVHLIAIALDLGDGQRSTPKGLTDEQWAFIMNLTNAFCNLQESELYFCQGKASEHLNVALIWWIRNIQNRSTAPSYEMSWKTCASMWATLGNGSVQLTVDLLHHYITSSPSMISPCRYLLISWRRRTA